jgi:hypothetical protein
MVGDTEVRISIKDFLKKIIKVFQLKTDDLGQNSFVSYVSERCLSAVSVDVHEDVEK